MNYIIVCLSCLQNIVFILSLMNINNIWNYICTCFSNIRPQTNSIDSNDLKETTIEPNIRVRQNRTSTKQKPILSLKHSSSRRKHHNHSYGRHLHNDHQHPQTRYGIHISRNKVLSNTVDLDDKPFLRRQQVTNSSSDSARLLTNEVQTTPNEFNPTSYFMARRNNTRLSLANSSKYHQPHSPRRIKQQRGPHSHHPSSTLRPRTRLTSHPAYPKQGTQSSTAPRHSNQPTTPLKPFKHSSAFPRNGNHSGTHMRHGSLPSTHTRPGSHPSRLVPKSRQSLPSPSSTNSRRVRPFATNSRSGGGKSTRRIVSSLSIGVVEDDHAGQYKCVATSRKGKAEQTVQLRVIPRKYSVHIFYSIQMILMYLLSDKVNWCKGQVIYHIK